MKRQEAASTDPWHRVAIACGQCVACRLDRASSWAVRILHEAQTTRFPGCCGAGLCEHSRPSSFITLTYDDAHLPPGNSLVVRDWQLFAKKARKRFGPFRFYAVGEYGERTQRAHYHAIIFGHDWAGDRVLHKPGKFGDLFRSEALTSCWGLGFASVGSVTLQSASYVARYCMKKVTGDRASAHYQGRKPEFSVMSRGGRGKRGGLGSDWVSRFKGDVFPSDETVVNGKRLRTPRYYDSKLSERELAELKQVRRELAQKFKVQLTTERLEAREVILNSRAALRASLL